MHQPSSKEQILEKLQSIVFEMRHNYCIWKELHLARSSGYNKDFQRNIEVMNNFYELFEPIERSCLSSFVTDMVSVFDGNSRNMNFQFIDPDLTNKFLKDEQNSSILKKIKTVRNKIISHKDIKQHFANIPSPQDMDEFWKRLEEFINEISACKYPLDAPENYIPLHIDYIFSLLQKK